MKRWNPSPRAQRAAMWILAAIVNVTGAVCGVVWGARVVLDFLPPMLGSIAAAWMVNYSYRA